jgi:hypothetical protein
MKVLKREIIYTCEIEWVKPNGKKAVTEIKCDNKGNLKSVPGISTRLEWETLRKEVKKQFRNKRSE